MSDQPEILQGAIAQEYLEMMQPAWFLDGPETEYPMLAEQPTVNGPNCSGDPEACATGDTCDDSCDDTCEDDDGDDDDEDDDEDADEECEPEQLAIQALISGWAAPPALHVR